MKNGKAVAFVGSLLLTAVVNLYSGEIKDSLSFIRHKFMIQICGRKQIIINSSDDTRYIEALDREIIAKNRLSEISIKGGMISPVFGNYELTDDKIGCVHLAKNKDGYVITINNQTITINALADFCNNIYNTYYGPKNYTTFYTIHDNSWVFTCVRGQKFLRNINPNRATDEVLHLLQAFDNNPKLNQLGFMFHSSPGKGKSLMVEVIAAERSMPVYILNINSSKLSDSDVNTLIMTVPPNSIILFEELDLQILSMQQNSTNHVSIGGLLSAMDGPARRSDNNIIIITTNDYLGLINLFPKDSLIRPGRIDHVINFEY